MDSATHHPHAVAQDASPERPFNANNEASSSGGRARFHDRDSSDGSEGGDSDSSVGPVASGGPRGDGAAHTTGANAAAPAQKRARLTHEDEAG